MITLAFPKQDNASFASMHLKITRAARDASHVTPIGTLFIAKDTIINTNNVKQITIDAVIFLIPLYHQSLTEPSNAICAVWFALSFAGNFSAASSASSIPIPGLSGTIK